MARFKDAPIFEIDEQKLEEIRNGPVPLIVAESKYKPGTVYATSNYPGYEGVALTFGISDCRKGEGGRVRITGGLPTTSYLPLEIDQTYTVEEFGQFLVDTKAKVSSGG